MPKVESQTEAVGVNGHSRSIYTEKIGVHPGQLKPPWVLRGFKTLILGHNGHSREVLFNGINAGRPPEVRIVPQIQIEGVENQEPGEAVRLIAGIEDEIAHLYDRHHVVSIDELDEQIASSRALKNTHKTLAVKSLQEWLLTHDEDLRRTKTGRVRKEETDRQKALIVRKAATKARKILNGIVKSPEDHLGLDQTTAAVISEYRTVSVATNRDISRQNRAKKELTQLMLLGNYLTKHNRIEHDIHLLKDAKKQVIDEISGPFPHQRTELNYYHLNPAHPIEQTLENIKKEVHRIERAARAEVKRGANFDPDFASQLHPLKQCIAKLEEALIRKESLVPSIVKKEKSIRGKKPADELKRRALDYLQRNSLQFVQPDVSRTTSEIFLGTGVDLSTGEPRYSPEDLTRVLEAIRKAVSDGSEGLQNAIGQGVSLATDVARDERVQSTTLALVASTGILLMVWRSLGEYSVQQASATTQQVRIDATASRVSTRWPPTPTPTLRPTFTPPPTLTSEPILRVNGLLVNSAAATVITEGMTATAQALQTETPTPIPSLTRTVTVTTTTTPTVTETSTVSPTSTNSPEPTRTSTNTLTPTATREPSPTSAPTKAPDSPTPTRIAVKTATPVPNEVLTIKKAPNIAPAVTFTVVVESKPVQITFTPTQQDARMGITEEMIRRLRVKFDGRRYSCMEHLEDTVMAFGDRGPGVVATINAVEAAESECKDGTESYAGSAWRLQIHRGTWANKAYDMFRIPFDAVLRNTQLAYQLARHIYDIQGMQAWDPCDVNPWKSILRVVNCEFYPDVYLGKDPKRH